MPPLKQKMNGKRYFNEIKKKEICLHQLFSKLHNNLPTKSPALKYTAANAALVFEIRSYKNLCFIFETCLPRFSIFEPPYPASYCTHINTLININGLHSSVNFNWRKFPAVKNSKTARCLNRTSENSSISMCTV